MPRPAAWLFAAALGCLAGPLSAAQTDSTPAGEAVALDGAGASARAAGMGGAYVATVDDVSAIFWNPAALSDLSGYQLAIHHNSWIGDTTQESGTLGAGLGPFGGAALSLNFVDFGTFEARDSLGNLLGSDSAAREGLGLAWGVPFLGGSSLGVGARASRFTLAGIDYNVLAGDLGLTWRLGRDLRLGLAYDNYSSHSIGTVGATVQGGFAWTLGRASAASWVLTGDGDWEPAGDTRLEAGLEGTFFGLAALRAGYQYSLQAQQLGGISGLSAGCGLKAGEWTLDYAWVPYGDLGASQQVSLSWHSPLPKVEEPQEGLRLRVLSDLAAKGQDLENSGDLQGAMAAFQQAVAADAGDLEAWKGLARCTARAGDTKGASACWTRVQELDPMDADAKAFLKKGANQRPISP